jgi:hypothetical protein
MKILVSLLTALIIQSTASEKFATGTGLAASEPGEKLQHYVRNTPLQKVYLHFNKNSYQAGEVMWFNSYLINSVTHLPDTTPTNIFIDLISSGGIVMEKRVLLAENGAAKGDISLPLVLPDGNYRIQAYTDPMRGFGEDLYFNRYFYITNRKYEDMISRSQVRSNKRFNKTLKMNAGDYEIAFFPEGGELIQGVNNRIAFKAVDALGNGLDATGSIIDQGGKELVSFSTLHAGMGSFELKPEAGSIYRALVSYRGDRQQVSEFPVATRNGISLRADRENENILIGLQSGIEPDEPGFIRDIYILAHTRGEIKYSEKVEFSSGKAKIVIPEKQFSPGITQITVFSGTHKPLAERLVFIGREDDFIFRPHVFRSEYEGEEYYGLQMAITDHAGNPAEGNFSMSILDVPDDYPGNSDNITSNILITSDLEGIIEDPWFYLEPGQDRGTELDHLMMTHGWRRFNWEKVLSGGLPEFNYVSSPGLAIRGRVIDPSKEDPVNNFQVRMRVLNEKIDVYTTRTDRRGHFIFDDLMYYGAFRVEIGSNRLPGDYPPNIELFTDDVSGYKYIPNIYTREAGIIQRGRDWKRTASAGKSPYSAPSEHRPAPRRFGTPDQTIYIDREKETRNSVLEVLRAKATGLQANGNRLQFRGTSSLNLSNEPMFMIDGAQTGSDVVLRMHPREVERIEIFRGTSAAIFGVRGGSGVIIVYQRRAGDPGLQDSKEYLMAGYHSPREFYSDMFTIQFADKQSEINAGKAIYWKPDINSGGAEDKTVLFPLSRGSSKLRIIIEGVGSQGGLAAGVFTVDIQE